MSDRLEHCREIWMQAALEDRRQFHVGADVHGNPQSGSPWSPGTEFTGSSGSEACAVSVLTRIPWWDLRFLCPDHQGTHAAWHFNNLPHKWTWLQLARKLGEHPYEEVGG